MNDGIVKGFSHTDFVSGKLRYSLQSEIAASHNSKLKKVFSHKKVFIDLIYTALADQEIADSKF